ncbi:PLIN5 protein, partial [Sagittarius serpentarius]|nr:PLIN5 protein [Sagittarius serpentarius]
LAALQVEARTLAVLRGLLRQLHAACTRLAAGAWGLPSSMQETAGHVRHGVGGGQGSLLEDVGQPAPLPWLVGPFAPALVEYPEGVPVEMAKWEGCVTVG